MPDKIPVFDNLGNNVGDFIPAGAGCPIGILLLGILGLMWTCLPLGLIAVALAVPLAVLAVLLAILIWLLTKPANYPYKSLYIVITVVFFLAAVVAIVLALSCKLNPSSISCWLV